MAGSKKFSCEFEGMDELISRISKLDGDIKATTEKALKKTHSHVIPNLHTLMKSHKRTGRTERSIQDRPNITWVGNVASVDIGFDISNGGLASIFLMYGTPRMKKDTKLYDAIYGKKTIQEVRDLQRDIFYEELRKLE